MLSQVSIDVLELDLFIYSLILTLGKEEKEVIQILIQVNITKREQEIKLDEEDFDEKRKINKHKKLISQGLESKL